MGSPLIVLSVVSENSVITETYIRRSATHIKCNNLIVASSFGNLIRTEDTTPPDQRGPCGYPLIPLCIASFQVASYAEKIPAETQPPLESMRRNDFLIFPCG